MTDLPTPDYARNMRVIGHSDQGGRPDGMQLMVHRGHAYVAHMFSGGFSVIDVGDPANPRTLTYVPAPANTWTIHLQTHDDLLLVANELDLFADAAIADERTYYKTSIGATLGTHTGGASAVRAWQARISIFDTSANRCHLGRSASCRSTAWVFIASGMSAVATPMHPL